MDIFDEELFDARPSCSTSSANTSLNITEQTNDSPNSTQEKDNATIKDISIKLRHLPDTKVKEIKKNSRVPKKQKYRWRHGHADIRKRTSRFALSPSRSQHEFQKMNPATEVVPVSLESEEAEGMHTHLNNQFCEVGESYENNQKSEQGAHGETESCILSLSPTEEEEDSCSYICARTLPYDFHQKSGKTSDNGTIVKDTVPSFLLPSCSKNTEPSLLGNKSCLSNYLSSNSSRAKKNLIRSRLQLMVKKITEKPLNEWKYKRKYISSDSETEELPKELPVPKKKRRKTSLNENDYEDGSVSNAKTIGDNNLSESHLSLETIDKQKTNVQINFTARVILTRLEEMEDENVIKWRDNKMRPSDVIASEPAAVEEQQLDGQELSQTLVTTESQAVSTLSQEDRNILKTKDISKDLSLTKPSSYVKRHCTSKSRLNILKAKYEVFRKLRVLMLKLDSLLCSSKDGRYSATEVENVTKKYITFVSNRCKSRGLKMCKHVRLRRSTTMNAKITAKDHSADPSVSKEQSTNKILKPLFTEESSTKPLSTEESSTKDAPTIENNVKSTPFKIHYKNTNIQNQGKSSSVRTPGEKFTLSPRSIETWRNAFRKLINPQNPQPLSNPRNSPQMSARAKCESVATLPSTSMSSTKRNTPVGSPRKPTSPEKQTEASANPVQFEYTFNPESSVSSKNLPSDANVEKISSRSGFTQAKDSIVSKSPHKNVKEANVITADALLSKKISEMSAKLREKMNNLELSTSNIPIKTKILEVRGVEQSPSKEEQAYKCTACGAAFKDQELLLKHMVTNSHNTCTVVASPTSRIVSRSVKARLKKSRKKSKVKSTMKSKSEMNMKSLNGALLGNTVMNKYNKHLKNAKPSTSQKQCSSVSEGGSKEIPILPLKKSRKKSKVKSTMKSKFEMKMKSLNRAKILQSKNTKTNKVRNVVKLKQATCTVCYRVFDTSRQLFKHMFEHVSEDIRSMNTSLENEIASSRQVVIETNELVSSENVVGAAAKKTKVAKNYVTEQKKRLSENVNEINSQNLVTSEVSQHGATEERNEASNLSVAEYTVERDSQKQSTPVARNVKKKAMQNAEKRRTCITKPASDQSTKSLTICECHRPKADDISAKKIQIEIVLLCTTCKTLFRRLECFETHSMQDSAKGTLCNKNRRHRKSKLMCVNCQQVFNSLQELMYHLAMHSRQLNCMGTVSFCCNVCKVIFYCFGHLFKSHFQNHMKNSFFLASSLSFPRPSYIGMKLISVTKDDNDKAVEAYMQVAEHVCQDCETPFVLSQHLLLHKAVCPNVTNTSADPRNRFSISSARTSILLICGFCNKTFYSRMSFEVHSLEHTQKRDMHLHYTCASVTALTKVYICKVCTTMLQSLQAFEEHWQTHKELREDYICSRCHNHYNSIDLFQKHMIIHKNNSEMQQAPITCEVIYRDISNLSSETNQPKEATVDDLPCMDLSYFAEKTVKDKPSEPQEPTHSSESQSMQEPMILVAPESSVCSNTELQATKNVSLVPVQVPSPNVAVVLLNRNSNENLRNLDDDSGEEEELTIVLSESEESSVSKEIRRNADSTPSAKHQNAQENTKSTISNLAVTGEQMQCSNDTAQATTSAKISNGMNTSTNSNAEISMITPRESVNTQLNTNASNLKDKQVSVRGTSVNSTETRTDHANKTVKSNVDDSALSNANSRKHITESLPKDAMSSVPKSFLRVKNLAELIGNPMKKYLCSTCGLLFDSQQIREHSNQCSMSVQNTRQGKDNQTSLADKIWPAKPTFDPFALLPTSTHCSLPSVTSISTVTIPLNTRPKDFPQVVDTAILSHNSRKFQVAGVKPLIKKSVTSANVSKPNKTRPSEVTRPSLNNINATAQHDPQKTGYHRNLPPHVSQSSKKLVQPTKQQQSPGTAAVRPFLQIAYQNPKPPPPSYSQHQLQQQRLQHLQQLPQMQQQPPQVQQQPPQVQQQPQQMQLQLQILQREEPLQQQQGQGLRQQQQELQQQQQMLQQQQQQQQQQVQLQILQRKEPLQQQQGQGLRQQQQELQQQQQMLQQQQQQQQQMLQQQQELQQQQQQQQMLQQQQELQQQQQQQMNIGNDFVQYLICKTGTSFQLTSNDIAPTNTDMLVTVKTMQQIKENPSRYICLFCPGFECGSVQEFAVHEHSSKHEARSRYNSVMSNVNRW